MIEKDKQICALLAQGHKPPQIAKKMKLKTRAVEYRIDVLRSEYKAKTVVQLMVILMREQFIN